MALTLSVCPLGRGSIAYLKSSFGVDELSQLEVWFGLPFTHSSLTTPLLPSCLTCLREDPASQSSPRGKKLCDQLGTNLSVSSLLPEGPLPPAVRRPVGRELCLEGADQQRLLQGREMASFSPGPNSFREPPRLSVGRLSMPETPLNFIWC